MVNMGTKIESSDIDSMIYGDRWTLKCVKSKDEMAILTLSTSSVGVVSGCYIVAGTQSPISTAWVLR